MRNIANCMIDISDGLIQDASHLAKCSKLTIELLLNNIPLPLCKGLKNKEILDAALYGGDDYELLFSCDPSYEGFIKELSLKTNTKITKIGFFTDDKGYEIGFQNLRKKPKKYSYSHF